ncbi:glutamine synthetase [Actinobaculum suis]|uniref:Glutamine synthetase n=1 Tax=Actinobaculum suis TaxID=1657 RepID=A0A1G7BPG2_9ACTO|nr:type I glutamate--ammonia ligase [Actinobaculum suis]MDY5153803.1 type I glutamate--ammonia ligase [Actinobaculum suis]SDE29061.1 glutamine synthetase [Actinobaculum suis]VDG76661.1 glutamine synthetase, type I [Actinobaculum suis]
MFASIAEASDYIQNKENGVKFLDVRFCDLPGVMQHFTIPAHQATAKNLTEGLMFDGSSIRGFTRIHESDMKLVPDPATAYIDPFRPDRTLVMNFDVVDPFTGENFERDPRSVAARAEAYLLSTGIADTAYFAAEAEFYMFDSVRYENTVNKAYFEVDGEEGFWTSGRDTEGGNQGYHIPLKGGYFPVAPQDQHESVRDQMCKYLEQVGLEVERAHHEVGTGGQHEINYRFNSLRAAADDLMKFKYVIRRTAQQAGKTVTFMPKPLYGDNGSGMHCHMSLWQDGEPLFYDERGYGGLSDLARWYIGGLLAHGKSLAAITNPSVNSYHRLVPGFEAPINLVYSARNRSACIRIPVTGSSPAAKRVEFRVPDPMANPYLAFSAQLMAGLDGIRNRIEPPEPIDKDIYELPPEEYKDIEQIPASLDRALFELERDHEYLLEGGVFTENLVRTWIDLKMENEVTPLRSRPHPYEYELYYTM